MAQTLVYFCLCIIIRPSSCWVDVDESYLAELIIRPEPEDIITGEVGHEIEFQCINNIRFPMLEWYQIKGNLIIPLKSGNGAVTLKMKLTSDDNGTDIYCNSWDTENNVKSKSIRLKVLNNNGSLSSASPSSLPLIYYPNYVGYEHGGEQVDMNISTITITPYPRDATAVYNLGDLMEFTCHSGDMLRNTSINFYWFQVKDNLEILQKSTDGDNPKGIKFSSYATLLDDDTKLFCQGDWYTDEHFDSFVKIRSEYITLRVPSENLPDISIGVTTEPTDIRPTETNSLNTTTTSSISGSNFWNILDVRPTVTVRPEPDDVIIGKAGDVIQYTCNVSAPATIEYKTFWYQTTGSLDIQLIEKKRGELQISKQITEMDNNTHLYCKVVINDSQHAPSFIYSKYMKIIVQGDNKPKRTQVVEWTQQQNIPILTTTPSRRDVVYKHGEEVKFVCRGDNMVTTGQLAWYQVKENIDIYRGSQENADGLGWVTATLRMNATLSDDGTDLYCSTDYRDEYSNKFVVTSELITLHVRKDDPSAKAIAVQIQRRDSRKHTFDEVCKRTQGTRHISNDTNMTPENGGTNSNETKQTCPLITPPSKTNDTNTILCKTDDPDFVFLTSIMFPYLKKITEDQKLYAQADMLQVMIKYQPVSSSSDQQYSTDNRDDQQYSTDNRNDQQYIPSLDNNTMVEVNSVSTL